MKQQNTKLIVKVPRTKRRAEFLFHSGEFRQQVIANAKVYNRKKLDKFGKNGIDFEN